MAIEPTVENLLQIQTEITIVRAKHNDLIWKVRQGRLVEHAKLERVTIERAHRLRDQLMTAPARHAALLAAQYRVDPAKLLLALEDYVRTTLHEIAAGPRPTL